MGICLFRARKISAVVLQQGEQGRGGIQISASVGAVGGCGGSGGGVQGRSKEWMRPLTAALPCL